NPQVALPQELALEVITIEPFGAETGNDSPSVRRRRTVGLAAFEMPFELGHALKRGLFPKDLPAVLVDAENFPGVRGKVVHRRNIPIEARPHFGIGLAADCRRNEDAITPDDRTRMTQAGNRRLPSYVDRFGSVPCSRWLLPIGDSRGVRPTKLRPIH